MEKAEKERGPGSIKSSARLSSAAVAVCTGLLILYAAISWRAHGAKSPTYDETYHGVAAWTHLRYDDFRLDSEDPPLWQFCAALPNGRLALRADFHNSNWIDAPQKLFTQWIWCVDTLYRTPGNHPILFLAREQAMMLGVAIALGMLLGAWAWKLGGPAAAVVTTSLFSLDPGMLGYGPIVKNDVAFALAFAALCYALWRFGERLSVGWMFAIAGSCAAMLTIKFSGLIAVGLVPVMLLIRALSPRPWGACRTRAQRVLFVGAVAALSAAVSFGSIWAVYGFRFAPTNDPTVRLNTQQLVGMARNKEYAAAHDGEYPTAEVLARLPASLNGRAFGWAESHRVLPQAWLAGLLFTYQSALIRPEYLLGRLSTTGWWYYFPFAMLVKTPVTTLVSVGAAAAFAANRLTRRATDPALRWAAVCVFTPIVLYMASAMHSNLNIGVRHVLPVYPLLFVGVGCAATGCLRRWRRGTIAALLILGLALTAETVSAYPGYIAFFNIAAGGSRGGIRLLGDSNLDWGQDLPSLVNWQREHPTRPLYLAYFGLADPKWFGLRYTPLPGGYPYDSVPSWPRGACTVAVSATYLQGILVDPRLYAAFYSRLASRPPTAVLGGTIYLFDLDAR